MDASISDLLVLSRNLLALNLLALIDQLRTGKSTPPRGMHTMRFSDFLRALRMTSLSSESFFKRLKVIKTERGTARQKPIAPPSHKQADSHKCIPPSGSLEMVAFINLSLLKLEGEK